MGELGHATQRHYLSGTGFDQLSSGGGDRDVIEALRASERSRRLLVLRAILDETSDRTDIAQPLPPLEAAWDLLSAAQRSDPHAVDEILLHPHTGTWAGQLLRRLRGVSSHRVPLWVEVGYLHTLAAAAAIHAGIDASIELPAHAGIVNLPTLGFARLPIADQSGVAEFSVSGGRAGITASGNAVSVPSGRGDDPPGWFGLRRLDAETDGWPYSLVLDDLDPYREAGQFALPQRLADADVERWRQRFEVAWQLLVRHHGERAESLVAGLTTIVPRPATHRFNTFSASADESFGCATVSLPPDPVTLAVTMVHEFQHSKLAAVQHLVRLYAGAGQERLYVPWRADPRPLPGVLQGVYAFLGITEFWRSQRQAATGDAARFAHLEFAHWREQTWRAWNTLRAAEDLTDLGHRFVSGMGARLEPWLAEPVPADVLAAADAIAADHRATWRIRHVRPEQADVERLADAWMDGQARPPLLPVRPFLVAEAEWSTRRAARIALIRLSIADPEAFQRFLEAPPIEDLRDLVPGDVAYVSGDHAIAARTYRDQITADPSRRGAWVGLGLALAAAGSDAAAHAILERPELVRALYQEIQARKDDPPPPDTVAAWLGS
jgi:HEXXH motif-containing protein